MGRYRMMSAKDMNMTLALEPVFQPTHRLAWYPSRTSWEPPTRAEHRPGKPDERLASLAGNGSGTQEGKEDERKSQSSNNVKIWNEMRYAMLWPKTEEKLRARMFGLISGSGEWESSDITVKGQIRGERSRELRVV
jgi:hypothetical protein